MTGKPRTPRKTTAKKHATTRPARLIEPEIVDAEIVDDDVQPQATSTGTELAVRSPRGEFAPRADGDTITIQLSHAVTGLGAVNDVLSVVQNAEIDALFALGWAALYTGPATPAAPVAAVSTGQQALTSGQQQQVRSNLNLFDAFAPSRATPPQVGPRGRQILTVNPGADGWTLQSADASSVLNDATNQLFGAACASVVSTGGGSGTTTSLRKIGLPPMDLSANDIEVLVQVPDSTHLGGASCYLGNGGLASYFVQPTFRSLAGPVIWQPGEWYRLRFSCPTVPTAGTPARSAITDIQVSMTDDAGGKVTLRVQQVSLVPKHPEFMGGCVSINFDDSWESQWTNALPKLAQYGFPASIYPIVSGIDGPNHLTLVQLKQMRDLFGWEIGGHAFSGVNHSLPGGYNDLSPSDLEAELCNLKEWMRRNGFHSESFAYPQGKFNATSVDMVRHYFSSARTITSTPMETIPPNDPVRIRAKVVGGDGTGTGADTVANISALIDAAVAQGQLLILVMHDVGASSGSFVSMALFNGVIDYLATTGVPVLTLSNALEAMSAPRTSSVTPGLDLLAVGEETVPRQELATGISVGTTSMRLSYFTARKTEVVTQLRTMTGSTAAGSGVTLAKMGAFKVAADGALTLVGATASDTTLFAAPSQAYTRSVVTPFQKVKGQRYAFAVLQVGASVAPTYAGTTNAGAGTEFGQAPALGGTVAAQSDLPSTVAAASVTVAAGKVYGVLLP